jgi:anti-sigma regulatory factor (Ser/Thr protein kinase)
MIKIHPKHRRLIRSPKEARFQRRINIAFHQMATKQFRLIQKPAGTLCMSVFPKNMDKVKFDLKSHDFLFKSLKLNHQKKTFAADQIYDYLKNAQAHGGDALVVARRYASYREGKMRRTLEIIIWDNGPGIKDLKLALKQKYSSTPNPYGFLAGLGLGLDRIIAWGHYKAPQIQFAADELTIETGYRKVIRKTDTDEYSFTPSGKKIPGTKITARFWL